MQTASSEPVSSHAGVARSLAARPIIGVVRTPDAASAEKVARAFIAGGLELIEVTFTVPGALEVAAKLLQEREDGGPPFIGMGTVTTAERAEAALGVGAELIVSPNVAPDVAELALQAGRFLVLGALTPTEIVQARRLGADLVKVYPVGPLGGASYLATIRQPLDDIPMLAGGGYDIEEIPALAQAGASAFGIGGPLVGGSAEETEERIARALSLCP